MEIFFSVTTGRRTKGSIDASNLWDPDMRAGFKQKANIIHNPAVQQGVVLSPPLSQLQVSPTRSETRRPQPGKVR